METEKICLIQLENVKNLKHFKKFKSNYCIFTQELRNSKARERAVYYILRNYSVVMSI